MNQKNMERDLLQQEYDSNESPALPVMRMRSAEPWEQNEMPRS